MAEKVESCEQIEKSNGLSDFQERNLVFNKIVMKTKLRQRLPLQLYLHNLFEPIFIHHYSSDFHFLFYLKQHETVHVLCFSKFVQFNLVSPKNNVGFDKFLFLSKR